jgi:hypothetical protein
VSVIPRDVVMIRTLLFSASWYASRSPVTIITGMPACLACSARLAITSSAS